MTLKELSKNYEEAAQPLRRRLKELRGRLKTAEDPEEIWHLRRRIAVLTPILTEMNELTELTANYYERGYYPNEKYSVAFSIRGRFDKKKEAKGGPEEDHPERADGQPAGYGYCGLDRGQVTETAGRRKRRSQIHGQPEPAPGPGPAAQVHPVPLTISDALLDSLLGGEQ